MSDPALAASYRDWCRLGEAAASGTREALGWEEMQRLLEEDPSLAWEMIVEVADGLAENEGWALSSLDAGALEDLLRHHGTAFIDDVERAYRRDRRLAVALGSVVGLAVAPEDRFHLERSRRASSVAPGSLPNDGSPPPGGICRDRTACRVGIVEPGRRRARTTRLATAIQARTPIRYGRAVVSSPSEFECDTVVLGETYRCTWLGLADVAVMRVRGLAFTEPGKLLLVLGDDGYQIPGGGIEAGESVQEALARELMEEAGATVVRSRRIGAFRIEGVTNDHADLHDFYWCHITLAGDWIAPHDISERVLVDADGFLDTLPWGRSDPRAAFLLNKALEIGAEQWAT